MPRIRTIKPELWESPDVLPMDDAFQALWCWLISNADDAGRLHTDAAHIAHRRRRPVRLVERRLEQMEQHGMITRYQVEAKPYLALLNWEEHQYIHNPAKHVHPAPPNGAQGSPRESSRGLPRIPASRAAGPDPTVREGPDRKDLLTPSPLAGEPVEEISRRAAGTNPRATGTSPRARGTNPRAQGTNPARREMSDEDRRDAYLARNPKAGEFRPDST